MHQECCCNRITGHIGQSWTLLAWQMSIKWAKPPIFTMCNLYQLVNGRWWSSGSIDDSCSMLFLNDCVNSRGIFKRLHVHIVGHGRLLGIIGIINWIQWRWRSMRSTHVEHGRNLIIRQHEQHQNHHERNDDIDATQTHSQVGDKSMPFSIWNFRYSSATSNGFQLPSEPIQRHAAPEPPSCSWEVL